MAAASAAAAVKTPPPAAVDAHPEVSRAIYDFICGSRVTTHQTAAAARAVVADDGSNSDAAAAAAAAATAAAAPDNACASTPDIVAGDVSNYANAAASGENISGNAAASAAAAAAAASAAASALATCCAHSVWATVAPLSALLHIHEAHAAPGSRVNNFYSLL
jgi:hypothetical protein